MSAPKLTPAQAFTEVAVQHSLGISHPAIYKSVFDIFDRLGIKQGHLLDYGSGQGDFPKAILQNKYGFTIHAVDLMFTKMNDVNWYVQDLNRALQFKDNQFDMVSCIEVIEHLENPRRVVRELFRVLKPGGWCVLTTPNNESWRAILSYVMRGHFVSFTDSSYPAHITALNKTDLMRVFKEAGFAEPKCSYTGYGVIPKFTNHTWQEISGGALKGKRYSDNIVFAAQKIVEE
jgi:2-polyprenyl-3-methyl-5-hydroxy-6-metoxy-1,4-benzoquinol methylase